MRVKIYRALEVPRIETRGWDIDTSTTMGRLIQRLLEEERIQRL